MTLAFALACAALVASVQTPRVETTATSAPAALTAEQKAMIEALNAALARYDRLIGEVTEPGIRSENRAFSDAYKDRRDALRKAFDQTKYDDLSDALNIAHQRLNAWMKPPLLQPPVRTADSAPPKTLLTVLGKKRLEERFTPGSFAKHFSTGGGTAGIWEIVADQLRVSGKEGQHPPQNRWKDEELVRDMVIRFRFRLEGKSLGLSFTEGEHRASIGIVREGKDGKGSLSVSKMEGMGGSKAPKPTRRVKTSSQEVTLDPARWYVAILEKCGNEMLLRVEGFPAVYLEADGLNVDTHVALTANISPYAWFDDLEIWDASLSPNWEKEKGNVVPK